MRVISVILAVGLFGVGGGGGGVASRGTVSTSQLVDLADLV